MNAVSNFDQIRDTLTWAHGRAFGDGRAQEQMHEALQALSRVEAALDAERERNSRLQEALRETLEELPTGDSNVARHAKRQRLHRQGIDLLGAPEPAESFVPSGYWQNIAAAFRAGAGSGDTET